MLRRNAMDVTSLNRTPALPATAPVAPVEIAAENREVVRAVQALNASEMLGHDELVFQRDQKTQRMLVQVVDRKTKEVVSQVPPEYILSLAAELPK
jgi:uncharacterized FlaG/YvyC family protein